MLYWLINTIKFINVYCSHNVSQPVYINIIRDPFERMMSWFYFRRKPTRKKMRLGTDPLHLVRNYLLIIA